MNAMSDGAPRPIQLSLVLDHVSVGGAEILLLNLCRGFDRTVIEPRVVCLKNDGDLAPVFRDAGIPVDVIGRGGRYDLRTVPRLVRQLRRTSTDAVLMSHHHRASLTIGRIAARLARTKANVLAAHDMGLTQVGKRVFPSHVVNTLFLSHALVLLAPSQGDYLHQEEGVGRFPWSRIREVVIGNGVTVGPAPTSEDRRVARERLDLAPDDVAIGMIARLTDQKSHETALRAVSQLVPLHPALRLILIGDGPNRAALEVQAKGLGIADQVRFLGTRSDVAVLLPGLDLACLSSVNEGAPMVVLEAMSAGLPFVTTDTGALRDMVTDGHDGFVTPIGDVDELAARLEVTPLVDGFQQLLTSLVGGRP
jgi:glycosyltransferase involved in cell wall biosynthesis